MKRTVVAVIMVLSLSALAFAQAGSVRGVVTRPNGEGVAGACVLLSGVNGGHPRHDHFRTITDPRGGFSFNMVPAGAYTISANFRLLGFAAELIEVRPRQTTNVTLVLQPRDSLHRRDSLVIVNLQGRAMVERPDPNRPRMARYFLDVDADEVADYALSFGPPWYDPDGFGEGAERPRDGDEITVAGGLFSYTDPPMVVVFEINGQFWRDSRRGHGGHGGGDHWRRGCNPDSMVGRDFEGVAMILHGEGFHGDRLYAIDTNPRNGEPDCLLDFGAPRYDPDGFGQGAERPQAGDPITIVGGQIHCAFAPIPIVIVYEINGLFWRTPGDTSGLGYMPLSVEEPIAIGSPASHLTARNYPNPFNPTTTISFSIPQAGHVTVAVFDLVGREVARLVDEYLPASTYVVGWNASGQPSGIYFYRVTVGDVSFTNRMVLLK